MENQGENNEELVFMMAKMRYPKGTKLFKNAQGVYVKKKAKNSYKIGLATYKDKELEERLHWLKTPTNLQITKEELQNGLKVGPPNHKIEEESTFCRKEMIKKILDAKNELDNLNRQQLKDGRSRANPYETIRSAFFMNRAALKLANIDASTNFMFTKIHENPFFEGSEPPYYFADVCGGPGGFTEYILWRGRWNFKGFGFTLTNCGNDFRVDKSPCVSDVTFRPLFGVHKNGDIFIPENITSFRDDVMRDTDGKGVHFMVTDGGFSVAGNENLQEIFSKQLYACQCYMALEIVRPHGHFMSKLFDIFTPFSAGLVYLMHLCFEKIAIIKPKTSRPANSERYLVCQGLLQNDRTEIVKQYLKNIVDQLYDIRQIQKLEKTKDINEIVSVETMKKSQLVKYIRETNNFIAQSQLKALRVMVQYYHNREHYDRIQETCRTDCLRRWHIPDCTPEEQRLVEPNLDEIYENFNVPCEQVDVNEFKNFVYKDCSVQTMFGSLHDCYFVIAHRKYTEMYKLGNNSRLINPRIKLTMGTVLVGELVKEYFSLDDEAKSVFSFHVIDAYTLGDQNIQELPFYKRQRLIRSYCKAVNFECDKNAIRIRPKYNYFLNTDDSTKKVFQYNYAEDKFYCQIAKTTYFYVTYIMFTTNKDFRYIVELNKNNWQEIERFLDTKR